MEFKRNIENKNSIDERHSANPEFFQIHIVTSEIMVSTIVHARCASKRDIKGC